MKGVDKLISKILGGYLISLGLLLTTLLILFAPQESRTNSEVLVGNSMFFTLAMVSVFFVTGIIIFVSQSLLGVLKWIFIFLGSGLLLSSLRAPITPIKFESNPSHYILMNRIYLLMVGGFHILFGIGISKRTFWAWLGSLGCLLFWGYQINCFFAGTANNFKSVFNTPVPFIVVLFLVAAYLLIPEVRTKFKSGKQAQ